MPPQIIRLPGGEELVVLPRAEYEALLERANTATEDAEDVAIYDARKAELAAEGVAPPAGLDAAILGGKVYARRLALFAELQNVAATKLRPDAGPERGHDALHDDDGLPC